ncbi:MAG: serine protease, partial [Oscillospiraceae bacterium]|nr:serine protease [Oscillospiraceae bacterium]
MNKSLWVEASLRAGELDRLEFMPRLWRKGMVITMKKTVSLITALALFILPLIGIVSASGGTPKVILDARESVVRVVTIWGDSYGHGTGFIIAHHGGKTYIATNRHVIVDNRDEVGDVKIVLTTAQGVLTDARVRFVGDRDDPTMDVVVLEVSDGSLNGRPTLPIISSDKVSAGDVIYTVGFPAGGDRFAEGVYPSRPEDMTILSGLISNTNSVHAGRAYVQHSADTHGGNSGGPLLNVKGEVVGIHTLSDVDAVDSRTTIKAALHTSYLISYCERNNIPIKIGANSFFNTTTIIMIAAGVVVIIVVAFALGKKRPAAT